MSKEHFQDNIWTMKHHIVENYQDKPENWLQKSYNIICQLSIIMSSLMIHPN